MVYERVFERVERIYDRGLEKFIRRERSVERGFFDLVFIERGVDERVFERFLELRDRREESLFLREEKRVGKDKERIFVKLLLKVKFFLRFFESVIVIVGESIVVKSIIFLGFLREEVCSILLILFFCCCF